MRRTPRIAICDLDGTLIDSDGALADAYVSLGVPREQITFGHVVAEECARWGITVEEYEEAYQESAVEPFLGVIEMIESLTVWAVCSNKLPRPGRAELRRFGWEPTVAMFADEFDGPKSPTPVLRALDLDPRDAVFLGDTAHDRAAAHAAGLQFALAGWNPRARPEPGDVVLPRPMDLLELLDQSA